jgi:hypothetical protein
LWPFLPCVLTCLFFDRSFWSGGWRDPPCFVWASFFLTIRWWCGNREEKGEEQNNFKSSYNRLLTS